MANELQRVKYQEVRRLLESRKNWIAAVASRYMNPERVINLTYQAMVRSPELLECDPMSIVRSVATAAQLGLEPDGLLGKAYLVPISITDKRTGRKRWVCQLWVGYLGLLDLVRRSGEVLDVQAQVVREGDEFDFCFGTGENYYLRHKPSKDPDRSQKEITHAWAMAVLKGGVVRFEVMDRGEIERIKSRSAAARRRSSPWDTDYEMMARKTVLRRLCKTLPLTSDALQQVQTEEMVDAGPEVAADVYVEPVEDTAQPQSRTQALKEKVVQQNGERETAPVQESEEDHPGPDKGRLLPADG